MQFQRQHDLNHKEAVFIAVESGQAAAIPAGYLCAWDTTDYSATAGILANTWGHRVVVFPTAEEGAATDGKRRMAGFAHVAIPAFAAFASSRGPLSLIQVYGFRSDIPANTDANTNIIVGGVFVPSGDEAGTVEGLSTETTLTVDTVSKTCGTSYQVVAINTTTTFSGWIRLM